jgi:hypothetical protein
MGNEAIAADLAITAPLIGRPVQSSQSEFRRDCDARHYVRWLQQINIVIGRFSNGDVSPRTWVTGMPSISSLLLILALQANAPLMRANFLPVLKQPFFGCAEKADLEHLMHLMTRLPPVAEQRADALGYGRAHCIQIPKGIVSIERSEGDFSCVRSRASQRICLWVPRELIGNSRLDDGVF